MISKTPKATHSVLIGLVSLMIVACGGDGSESAPTIAKAPSIETVATPEPQPEPLVVNTTSDLVADSTFELPSHRNVSVNVDISGTNNNQGYLSICRMKSDGTPDYEDCYLRTALPDGSHQSKLWVATNVQAVVSAIWFLDLSAEPVITRHDLAAGRLTFSI